MLTASRERGVIGGREIDAQHPEDRGQEALGLTHRSVEDATERQRGFDGEQSEYRHVDHRDRLATS